MTKLERYFLLLNDLYKKENNMNSIEKILEDVEYLNNQINGLNVLLEEKKEYIKQYLDKNNIRNVTNENVTAYYTERTKVDYDIPKAKDILDPKLKKLIIKNTYTLNNFDEFKDVCKKYDVPAKEVKNMFNVETYIDQDALSKLYDSGKIDINTISEFTSTKTTKSLGLRFNNEKATLPVK